MQSVCACLKGEKLVQGESELFFAARQRQKRADYILVTPFFVPVTLRITTEVLLDQHALYHAVIVKEDHFMPFLCSFCCFS